MIFKNIPETKWALENYFESADELIEALTKFHTTVQHLPSCSCFFFVRQLVKAIEKFELALISVTDFRNRLIFDPWPENAPFITPKFENDTRDEREIYSVFVQMEPKFLKIDDKYNKVLPFVEIFFNDIAKLWPNACYVPYYETNFPMPEIRPEFTCKITFMQVDLLDARLIVAKSIFAGGMPRVHFNLNNSLRQMAINYAKAQQAQERNKLERVIDLLFTELEGHQFRPRFKNEVFGEVYTFQPMCSCKTKGGTCYGLSIQDKLDLLLFKKDTEELVARFNAANNRIESCLMLLHGNIADWLTRWPPSTEDIASVKGILEKIYDLALDEKKVITLKDSLDQALESQSSEEIALQKLEKKVANLTEVFKKATHYGEQQTAAAYVDAEMERTVYHTKVKKQIDRWVENLKTAIKFVYHAIRIMENAEEGTTPDELANGESHQKSNSIGSENNPAHIVIDASTRTSKTTGKQQRGKMTIPDKIYIGKNSKHRIVTKVVDGKQTFTPKGGDAEGMGEQYVITAQTTVNHLLKLLEAFEAGDNGVVLEPNWPGAFNSGRARDFNMRFIEKARSRSKNQFTGAARINLNKTSNFYYVD